MLKNIPIICLVCVVIFSCKKSSNDAPSNTMHFTAKINGVQTNFNTSVQAQVTNDPSQGDFSLFILAIGGNPNNSLPSFDLEINSAVAITTGTYVTKQDQFIWEASATYWVDGATWYDNNSSDFTVTVTSLTANQVSGTFSGTVADGAVVKTITDGSFTAQIP